MALTIIKKEKGEEFELDQEKAKKIHAQVMKENAKLKLKADKVEKPKQGYVSNF